MAELVAGMASPAKLWEKQRVQRHQGSGGNRMESHNVTGMLVKWGQGDKGVLNQLLPAVYDELHRMAARYLHRERPDHTLQPTALINEAYLRLVDQSSVTWENRAHFFGIAANAMRRILVDHARGHQAAKRGGSVIKLPLDEAVHGSPKHEEMDLVALDAALTRLAKLDPEQRKLSELRYFGPDHRGNSPGDGHLSAKPDLKATNPNLLPPISSWMEKCSTTCATGLSRL